MSAFPKPATLFAATAMTALTLAGGAGLAMAQDGSSTDSPSTTSQQPMHKFDHGQRAGNQGGKDAQGGGQRDAELASKLGVSADQLHQAFQSVSPDNGDMITQLATALGKDKSEVQSAFDSIRAEAQQKHRDELSSRLDKAVADGKISTQDKDSILKAFDAGVLGGPEGGPNGAPGIPGMPGMHGKHRVQGDNNQTLSTDQSQTQDQRNG